VRAFLRLNGSLLSPLLAFCAAWTFAALLSQLHVLNGQRPWSNAMVAVAVSVPLAFLAGGLIGEGVALRVAGAPARSRDAHGTKRLFHIVLVVFIVIGLGELAHQFVKVGGIPLLSANGNALRFNQGGPTIVLTDLLTVAAIAALVRPRSLVSRESRFELTVAAIALMGFALQAGRGSVILPIIAATAGRWLYWGKPKGWLLGAAALIAFVAVVFGFYVRTRQNPFNPFEAELYGEILPGTPIFLQPLVPIYLALTTNFVALQGVVGHFPTIAPFGHGIFDALGLNAVFTGAQNISDVSATLTPPWVTSTVAGPLWADGGFPVLVPGVAMTGFLSAGAFAAAIRTRSFRWSMVAAYLLYVALFGLYSNLWTQEVDWILVAPLLLVVGAIIEDPTSPQGLTGRVWARIRPMIGIRAADHPAQSVDRHPPKAAERRLARDLVLSGLAIIVVLLLSGIAIQGLLPEPYPLVTSTPLPQSLSGATAVMTNSDLPQDNQPLEWVNARTGSLGLSSYQPGAKVTDDKGIVRIAATESRRTSFDIGAWAPWRTPALFAFRQRRSWLFVTVTPTVRSEGPPQVFKAPIAAPAPGTTNEEMMATWSGTRPDLFIVTRGSPASRAQLRILSGESGFKKQLFVTRLPFRGLAPDEWAMDVGRIAAIPNKSEQRVVRGDRPDLLLVHHEPGKEHSDVQVLLGESGFEWDAFQRDLDTPGSAPPGTDFLLGTHLGGKAIYEVRRHGAGGPDLRVFGLENPPQFR
jgi:oligosaccharide repeat unit polymerase